MKRVAIAVAAMLAAQTYAQMLGADRSIVAESVSNVHTNYSWEKNVVTETADGQLRDKQRALASAADAAAQAETVKSVGNVAKAWRTGFSNGVASVAAALANIPKNGRFIRLEFPLIPQTSRKFDIFVVSNSYNSAANEDTMWIYFGQSFTNAPTMTVPFVYESGMTTQRVVGAWKKAGTSDHFTNVVNITRVISGESVTYPCHKLYVKRPDVLANVPCNLFPHGVWGTPEGVTFGSYLLNVVIDGTTYPTWTGQITNVTEGVVAIFDNGAFLGTVPIQEE